jgi:alanyl-tRNA synthetase
VTERLYYKDPDLLEFTATIVAAGTIDDREYVSLDRSAFYPTSGGQLHDTGQLNNIAVIDVIESETGEVLHVTGSRVGEPGLTVEGVVDRDRRRQNCQLHTAQHLLSQSLITLYDQETVSVHLGEDYGAVEIDTTEFSESQMLEVERFANERVHENLQIEILFVSTDEAASLPLRKIPERTGNIRVIKTGEFDYSACGGTHCVSTAQVGLIKLIGKEKARGRTMIRFLSGIQAESDYRIRYAITDQLTRELTCNLTDLPEKYARERAENKVLRKRLTELQKELLPGWAKRLTGEAKSVGRIPLVMENCDYVDAELLGNLASQVADSISGVAVLSREKRLAVAVSTQSGMDAGALVRRFCKLTSLRGGGNAKLAQIGGVEPEQMDKYYKIMGQLLKDA